MDQIVLHYREAVHRERLRRADRIEELAIALRPDAAKIINQLRRPDGG